MHPNRYYNITIKYNILLVKTAKMKQAANRKGPGGRHFLVEPEQYKGKPYCGWYGLTAGEEML